MELLFAIFMSCISVFLIGYGSSGSMRMREIPGGYPLILERTSAQDEFTLCIVLANIGLLCLSSLLRVSNHSILTLDILFNLSLLFLIKYHSFKEPEFSL